MHCLKIRIAAFLLSIFIVLLLSFSPVAANDVSYGVANYVPIEGSNVIDGYIVSSINNGFFVSNKAYDENIVGVITTRPAISFIDSSTGDKYPMVASGKAYVLVSGLAGPVQVGDPITTSVLPGIGMKAMQPGLIIGTSLEEFAPQKPNDVKKIELAINIRYHGANAGSNSFFDVFKISLLSAANEQPPAFFKYLTAGSVVLGSVVLGFYFFGKVASKGIEALGRNPMAGRMIQFGITVNVLITIVTIASGLIIAIIILRL